MIDLANKTRALVQESATQEGLGYLTKTATFDVNTLETLRNESGLHEAKVFNLVRGLRQEVEQESEMASVLLPLKERAESILKDLENRKITALEAMDQLDILAREKEEAIEAAKNSGLSPRAFGIHLALKDDPNMEAVGISTLNVAQKGGNATQPLSQRGGQQRRTTAAACGSLSPASATGQGRAQPRCRSRSLNPSGHRHR